MPRRLRLDAPRLISHVTARGVNGCSIYGMTTSLTSATRDLAHLGDVVDRFDWLLYAY